MAFGNVLIHNCTIYRKYLDQSLNFDGGTHSFTVGEEITSGIQDASGNWTSIDASGNVVSITGDSSGNLRLYSVTGTFVNNHLITGSLGGSAYCNGINADYLDSNGQPVSSDVGKSYRCRFFKKRDFRQSGKLYVSDIAHLVIPLSVMLPANVDIQKDDIVVTTSTGYAGTYSIFDFDPIYGRSIIHHYVADVVRVE